MIRIKLNKMSIIGRSECGYGGIQDEQVRCQD